MNVNRMVPVLEKIALSLRTSSPRATRDLVLYSHPQCGVEKFDLRKETKTCPSLLTQLNETRFVLVASGNKNTLNHIDAWYSYCRAVGENVVIIVESRPLFRRVVLSKREATTIYIKSEKQVRWLLDYCKNLKIALYTCTRRNSTGCLKSKALKHVFIGHGDSEKLASSNELFLAYDEIWTAGQAHIDRLSRSPIDFSVLKKRVVGRPQVRELIKCQNRNNNKFIYLPTWEGVTSEQDYSSVNKFNRVLLDITEFANLDLVVKFHPLTGKRRRNLRHAERVMKAEASRNDTLRLAVLSRSDAAIEVMKNSDFMISDISSVISDFLVMDRPIFIYLPETKAINVSNSAIALNDYCYTYSTAGELVDLIKTVVVNGDDYLAGRRREALGYIVDIEKTLDFEFEKQVEKACQSKC